MPETPEEWKARVGVGKPCNAFRRVGGPGTTKRTPVDKDTGPGVSGTTTEHWNGRVDAHVTAPQITVNPNLKGRPHGD